MSSTKLPPLFSKEQIAAIKEINIVDYLHSLGFKETHTAEQKRDYFFDLTNSGKKSGDVHVNNKKNVYYSFSDDNGGDIIKLVQQLQNVSFIDAVKLLSENNITPLIENQQPSNSKQEIKQTKDIVALTQAAKINILTNYALTRHINKETLLKSDVQFLSQDVISNKELKTFFFIGLKNDSNGYSVRNKGMKGMRGNTDITTISKSNDKPYIIVEGLFEYLSVLESTKQYDLNFIILNSTVNARKASDKINTIDGSFLLLLNNDAAGKKAADQILSTNNTKQIENGNFQLANDLNAAIQSESGKALINDIVSNFQKKNSTVFNSPLNTTVMARKKTNELELAQPEKSTDQNVQQATAQTSQTAAAASATSDQPGKPSETAPPEEKVETIISEETILADLQKIMTEEQAIQLLESWKAASADQLTKSINEKFGRVGTLIEHGVAKYEFKPDNAVNYFVKFEDLSGKERTIWGKEFEQAFSESPAKAGDTVSIEFLGKKDVTVKIPVKDQEGNIVDYKPMNTHRNSWNINTDTEKIVAEAKALASFIDISKPVKSVDQEPKQQKDHKNSLTKDVRRAIFDQYLTDNGAAGKTYEEIKKQYDKLREANPKKNRPDFGFLDQLVHRGFSDVIEIVYLVVNKIKDASGQEISEKKPVEGMGRIKMDIVKNAKGEYEVVEMPIVKRREAKKPKDNYLAMIGYKATNEEIEKIYDKKITVLCGNEGNKYYIRFDPDTNNLILRNQKSLSMEYVPKEMMGVALTDQHRKDLYDGKAITLDIVNYTTKDNKTLNGKGTFEYSPIEHRFIMDRYYSNETLENFKQRETNLLQNLEHKQDKRNNIINEKEQAKEQTKDNPGIELSK